MRIPEDRSVVLPPQVKRRLKRVERAFHRHNAMLIGWLAKKLGDHTLARDLAQDAFLRVWRSAHKTEINNPRALIFKTAANLAINEFKARKRYYENHVDTAATHADKIEMIAADQPSPERIASARQDYKTCMEVIEDFPEKVRAAFIKSRFESLTYREIAEDLQVSESSVEKYIITALKDLRAALSVPEDDEHIVSLASRVGSQFYARARSAK